MNNSNDQSIQAALTTTETRPVFQMSDPLPIGMTTMLEASAGTGKTYTLAALAVRFIAEHDISISEILLVTFTKAATAELKDRIRERLSEAAEHLLECQDTDDPLLELLGKGEPDKIAIRRERIETAVAEYDTAQIHTIHGFCAQVRESLGVLADINTDSVPTGDEGSLMQQVCADLIFIEASKRILSEAQALAPAQGYEDEAATDILPELPALKSLTSEVQKARQLGDCAIEAESGQPNDLLLRELVQRALTELSLRLAQTGQVSFDSLLLIVRDAFREDPQLVKDLQAKFKVALIDEFQDTDPIQWEIFNTAFGSGDHKKGSSASSPAQPCTLLLVGDPKQAIYSFRGGDVYT
ncbi:MAG: UvrD-helicase domain-containing protein, partial [Microthrixaceae bacterium]